MKKVMSLLVAVALVAFMTACGGAEETAQDQAVQQVQEVVEQPVQEVVEQPVQEAAEGTEEATEGAE